MKVLSIIAQKPSSTGSGVYLTELVKSFSKRGFEQEIICALYRDDNVDFLNEISNLKINPIYFDTDKIPFHIAGMSDVMPYESMKYSEFISDNKKLSIWENAFKEKIVEVIDRFKPDVIISHHLYLLTAITRDLATNFKVYGICHNTDLRQYIQTDLCRDFIKSNIKKLDMIFAPSSEHLEKAIELFNLDREKTKVIGIGYNNDIFKNYIVEKNCKKNKLLYVGKIAKKKGVLSLVKAFNLINNKNLTLDLIGGAGDKDEYNEIVDESKKLNLSINFYPPMNQVELAKEYNNHEIFILPSFSEGIPMVPIEAMACGCKVVVSDLPGVRNFYSDNIENAIIDYVPLPKLTNVDFSTEEELGKFENKLASSIVKILNYEMTKIPDLSKISWENLSFLII